MIFSKTNTVTYLFFCIIFDEIIIIFELNEFLKNSSSGKRFIKINMHKIAIRSSTVINGVALIIIHHTSFASTVTYGFYYTIQNNTW